MLAKHLLGLKNGIVRRYYFASSDGGIEQARLPDLPDM
jgi:hypothetical protein